MLLIRRLIFPAVFFLFPVFLYAEIINVNSGSNDAVIELGQFIEYYEDKAGNLTIDAILAEKDSLPFQKLPGPTGNFGYSDSVYWVRFSLKNPAAENITYTMVYHYALIGELDLYKILNSKTQISYEHASGGFYRPFHLRSNNYRNPNFNITLDKGENVYYMKIKTRSPINIHLVAYHYRDFISVMDTEMIMHGIYFGALLVIFLYNLFMYTVLKEINYFYFISFVLFFFLFSFSYAGYARQYFWPDASSYMMYSTVGSLGLAMVFVTLFTHEYLELKNKPYRYISLAVKSIAFLQLTSTFILFYSFSTGAQLIIFFSFFSSVIYMVIAMYYYFKDNRFIRYFVLGLLLLFAGWILTALQETGFLPGKSLIPLGFAGTVFMMAFISLSLIDRYNFMKDRILHTVRETIQSQENYGEKLQIAVHEKTRDILNEKNSLESFVKSMESDLKLARSIRDKILKNHLLKNSIPSYFKPTVNVGSDFLDYFSTGNADETGIILADVSGRGIHSTFNILILKTILLEAETVQNPYKIIRRINEFLRTNSGFGFISLFLCVFNSITGEVSYTNAGYTPPIIFSNKDAQQISRSKGIPMGVLDIPEEDNSQNHFAAGKFLLGKDEKLFLYSFGFSDAVQKTEHPDRLPLQNFLKSYGNLSAKDVIAELKNKIEDAVMDEDITILCLETAK